MMHPAFDPMDIAGLHLWQREESGDNSLQHQRLLQKLNMAQIAGRLGVNKSTVSRTLCRARRRLHHILQYSL